MFQIIKTSGRALVICGLILIAFAAISNAQTRSNPSWCDVCTDTAINPHDFTNEFYASQGILARSIIGRRNGYDYLSTLGFSSNPNHREVRVLATMAARGMDGEMLFWYPLGELAYTGFTNDEIGIRARQQAMATPLYVFPVRDPVSSDHSIFNIRQAAMLHPGPSRLSPDNAGLRVVVWVTYTEKAFTKEGQPMMDYMTIKNGLAADRTPAISSWDDMNKLGRDGLITAQVAGIYGDRSVPVFALAPVISDPTGGAIAPDAFLIEPMLDGEHVPMDADFAMQFDCLQRTGGWCKAE